MPLQKHLPSSPKKTRLLLCLPEDAWGHSQKGQRGFIGSLSNTTLRLPGAGLAGRCSLFSPQFRAAQVPPQHDSFPCEQPVHLAGCLHSFTGSGSPATLSRLLKGAGKFVNKRNAVAVLYLSSHEVFGRISQQRLLKKLCCQGWEEMPF